METSGIYAIRNVVNGKIYVGSSIRLQYRWSQHRSNLRAGRHFNPRIQRDFNLYGEGAFEFIVLETCDTASLFLREEVWAARYRAHDMTLGYNVGPAGCPPSQLGRKQSAETRAKVSAALKLRKGEKRKPNSPETRAKKSAALKGRPHTAEHNAKVGVAASRLVENGTHNFLRFIQDPAHRAKASNARWARVREAEAAQ